MTKPGLSHATQQHPMTPGLTRFDYQRSHGWFARYYTRDGVTQKLFSDSRYGYDDERSRAAARCSTSPVDCAGLVTWGCGAGASDADVIGTVLHHVILPHQR